MIEDLARCLAGDSAHGIICVDTLELRPAPGGQLHLSLCQHYVHDFSQRLLATDAG